MRQILSRRQFIHGTAAVLAGSDPHAPAHAAQNTNVFRASELVDSIGVSVHLSYSNTVYGRFDDIIMPRLLESGIRNVRDGIPTGPKITGREWIFQRGRKLVSQGLKFSCVTDFVYSRYGATVIDNLEKSIGFYDNGVSFLEGPNEPNYATQPDWPQRLTDYQKSLYEYVKNNAAIRHIPVLGPSITLRGGKAVGDISAWMDYGNIHPYPGGHWPESGTLDLHMKDAVTTDGQKPLVVTEIGYHSALATKRAHPAISEPMIARYMPRLMLWSLMKGLRHSYIYEFADTHDNGPTDQESNFGLVRPNGEAKPAFYAIKNLIALFGDAQHATVLHELVYSVAPSGSEAQTMCFQRSDGDYLIAYWLGVRGWDIPTMSVLAPVGSDLTIQFPQPMFFVDSTRFGDDGAVSTEKNGVVAPRLSLRVSDNLSVLRVRPTQ